MMMVVPFTTRVTSPETALSDGALITTEVDESHCVVKAEFPEREAEGVKNMGKYLAKAVTVKEPVKGELVPIMLEMSAMPL